MSHHLGVIHFPTAADATAEQVHKGITAQLDHELDMLDKAGICGPDYYTFAGLVSIERIGGSYLAFAHHPATGDGYDRFNAFARWLSIDDLTIERGNKKPVAAERLCGSVIDEIMPRPPDGHDTESVDALIDSFGVNDWKADRLCRYVMNAVSARVLALEDCATRTERLIRSETWRPRAAIDLGHPFIFAADGDLGSVGVKPADRGPHPTLKGRSILPPFVGLHWLAFVDFHT